MLEIVVDRKEIWMDVRDMATSGMGYCKLQQVINFALASKSVCIVHISSLHSYFGKKKNVF